KKIYIYLFLFFISGISAGWAANEYQDDQEYEKSEESIYETRFGGYQYINPLLECEIASERENSELIDIKKQIEDYINEKIQTKKISNISVYYRNLNNGPWFGINEDSFFNPASLLKVPILIFYYKLAETQPDILLVKVIYQGEYEDKENLENDNNSLIMGNQYTIEELINKMIVYSDNKSAYMLVKFLLENVDQELQNKILNEIEKILPSSFLDNHDITAKTYSSLFRILYNASYLNKEMSEKALELLAEVYYDKGLVAKIPREIKVSNKYGFMITNGAKSNVQLHDCGIIYYPESPYILCIMTKGLEDRDQLESIIQDISEMVYQEVSKNK
ncbi:MAG: serine hydrolase, partial [Patescibacteria group bacterium]